MTGAIDMIARELAERELLGVGSVHFMHYSHEQLTYALRTLHTVSSTYRVPFAKTTTDRLLRTNFDLRTDDR